MHLSKDQQHLLLFVGGVLLALAGLYLLAKRRNPAAVTAPSAATSAASNPPMPTANYAVTLDSYNGPGYNPPAPQSPTAPPPAALPLSLQGTGSAFPVQDNTAIVPQFPWG